MNSKMPTASSLAQEAGTAELGDRRLNRRLSSIVEKVARHPDRSFPKLASSDSELEGMYRFFGNERVEWQTVLGPHFDATAERVAAYSTVRVVHDPTEFYFRGEETREGLGPLKCGQGFLGRFGLALSPDEERVPLGLLTVQAVIRPRADWPELRELLPSERIEMDLWFKAAKEADERLPEGVSAIHIMDRGADSSRVLASMLQADKRFVIRAAYNRRIEPIGDAQKLDDVIETVQGEVFRDVEICTRKKGNAQHPARKARTARLSIRACTAAIIGTVKDATNKACRLSVNVVQVYEPSPPDNQEPVEWTLLTTEPIESLEDVTAVVDHYRARWVIEEYFKALKTGCAYEKRQLESAAALLVALAVLAPIAWRLLLLRTLSRHCPEVPATTVFSANELRLLRLLSKRVKLDDSPTIKQAMLAIAGLGGHIKNNGDPGWIVIGRGYEDFLANLAGWNLALSTSDQ